MKTALIVISALAFLCASSYAAGVLEGGFFIRHVGGGGGGAPGDVLVIEGTTDALLIEGTTDALLIE